MQLAVISVDPCCNMIGLNVDLSSNLINFGQIRLLPVRILPVAAGKNIAGCCQLEYCRLLPVRILPVAAGKNVAGCCR